MSEEMTLETLRLRTAALHRVCASLAGWRERAEKAEAKLERVAALADTIALHSLRESDDCQYRHHETGVWHDVADDIRAAIEAAS